MVHCDVTTQVPVCRVRPLVWCGNTQMNSNLATEQQPTTTNRRERQQTQSRRGTRRRRLSPSLLPSASLVSCPQSWSSLGGRVRHHRYHSSSSRNSRVRAPPHARARHPTGGAPNTPIKYLLHCLLLEIVWLLALNTRCCGCCCRCCVVVGFLHRGLFESTTMHPHIQWRAENRS